MDGFVWVKAAGGLTAKLVNASTGAVVAAGGLAGSTTKYNCALGKSSFGNYFAVWGDDTSPYIGYTDLGSDLTNIVPVNGTFIGSTTTDDHNGTGVCMNRVSENNRYIVSNVGAYAYIFDLDTKIFTKISGITDTGSSVAKLLYPNVPLATSVFGDVTVRATGVKTIE